MKKITNVIAVVLAFFIIVASMMIFGLSVYVTIKTAQESMNTLVVTVPMTLVVAVIAKKRVKKVFDAFKK